MFRHGRVEVMRKERVGRFVDEQERAAARRKAARNEPGPLGELLDSLARGLAGIGLPGGRNKRWPAGPAY